MTDFHVHPRGMDFLDNPTQYITDGADYLKLEPLKRQFKTAQEILKRFKNGNGVLLADDVGLGKTTVAALVAWIVACQENSVRIYVPNQTLRRNWARELERHIPLISASYDRIESDIRNKIALSHPSQDRIKQGRIGRLRLGRIQIATHHDLVNSYQKGQQRTKCDLMVIDEAHRAKGDGSDFNEALSELGDKATRKLILTATPFSIRIAELQQLLKFVGVSEPQSAAIKKYSDRLNTLYYSNDGQTVDIEAERLVEAAKAAVDALQPHLIRHSIDDLSSGERAYFGRVASNWEIDTPSASDEDIELLLRMDRILQLAPSQKKSRRNDPRFHTGWEHVGVALSDVKKRSETDADPALLLHVEEAQKVLLVKGAKPHPKAAAVSETIRPLIDGGEKVLVFCHHHATAGELLYALENSLKREFTSIGPPEIIWREAWSCILQREDDLVVPIIDWLCTPGIRAQTTSWIGKPAKSAKGLAAQLRGTRPRNGGAKVPTICEAAISLADVLLDEQSTSTRAVLKSIVRRKRVFGGQLSHFPGMLDDGYTVMGAWKPDTESKSLATLYTQQPDMVLAVFNSPFGPDVLVATDQLSEGVDLHRYCRHLIHYELDPSPVRTLQRNGRVRRVGSWAALTDQSICYAYPTFGGTRDEKAVRVMRERINAFGLLLGGVPPVTDSNLDGQSFAEMVLVRARNDLKSINGILAVR